MRVWTTVRMDSMMKTAFIDDPLGDFGRNIEQSVEMGALPWCVDCEGTFHADCIRFAQGHRKPVCRNDRTSVVASNDEIWQCPACRRVECRPFVLAHTGLLDALVEIVIFYV
jgi:hypothetical protein